MSASVPLSFTPSSLKNAPASSGERSTRSLSICALTTTASRTCVRNLFAEAFARARALHEAGDIDEFDGGGNDDGGFRNAAQRLQSSIRHNDRADVGIDRAERIVGRFRVTGARDCVEEGGLAHMGSPTIPARSMMYGHLPQ